MSIVEYIVDKILQGVKRWTAGRQKLGYFSLMKCFGFIDVNRTVKDQISSTLTYPFLLLAS